MIPNQKKLEKSQFQSIDEFTLVYKLGEGSFSTVYLAIHIQTQKKFAIKKIDKTNIQKMHLQNLYKEIQIHSQQKHLNIVEYQGYIVAEKFLYLILEHCDGGNLFQYLVKQDYIPHKTIKTIFQQILNGIEFLHKNNVVLRDLKPENILLDNISQTVKLCDFGWSGWIHDTEWLKEKAGTFVYMSPESLNSQYQGFESDIWALGILLYELFYNKEPFQGSTSEEIIQKIKKGKIDFKSRQIPKNAQELIIQILNPEISQRPIFFFIR